MQEVDQIAAQDGLDLLPGVGRADGSENPAKEILPFAFSHRDTLPAVFVVPRRSPVLAPQRSRPG
jgi:hypothetical protein